MRAFFLIQLMNNLRARPVITVVVVVLCAAGLTASGAMRSELDRALDWWEGRFTEPLFEVYLNNSLTETQALALQDQLSALEVVQRVDYVSADAARREAEQYLGAIAFSILPDNPLPASLRVAISPEYRNPYYVRRLTDSLITADGIIDIISADRQIAIYARGRQIITDYSTSLLFASVAWTVFWLFIGVFLMLRARSVETKVWRYLGARPGWLRWPPVAEGFILGLCAAGLGWAFLRLAGNLIYPAITADAVMTTEFAALLFVLPVAGGLAGWLAYRVHRKGGAYL